MNRFTKTLVAVLIAVFGMSATALAQARSQADVQVRSMTIKESDGKLTLKFEVFSRHDDDALNTRVLVQFPVRVKFLSSDTGCVASVAVRDGTQAFATCDIGRLGVGATRSVQVVTTVPTIPAIRKTFSAFAWSETPDPQPRNNYGEATAP